MISKEAEAIRTAILTTSFSNDDINAIIEAVRYSQNLVSQTAVKTFKVGNSVKYKSNRDNVVYTGIVEKVGTKFIVVNTNRGLVKVPAGMLSAA